MGCVLIQIGIWLGGSRGVLSSDSNDDCRRGLAAQLIAADAPVEIIFLVARLAMVDKGVAFALVKTRRLSQQ